MIEVSKQNIQKVKVAKAVKALRKPERTENKIICKKYNNVQNNCKNSYNNTTNSNNIIIQ